jgi:flagellin-like protein
MKKKAVSDVLGAIILIVIVIAGFSFLVYPLLLREYSASQGALKQNQQAQVSASTMIQLVYYTVSQNSQGTQITLYLYNYGQYAFTPNTILVNMPTAGSWTITSFTMQDVSTGNAVSQISPNENVELSFTVPYTGSIPSLFNVSVIGNNQVFTWEI